MTIIDYLAPLAEDVQDWGWAPAYVDSMWRQGDASWAKEWLGWEAKTKMPELAKLLVDAARTTSQVPAKAEK